MLLPELFHQEAQDETYSRLWSEGGLCTPQLYSLAGAGPRANNTDTNSTENNKAMSEVSKNCTTHSSDFKALLKTI